MLDPILEHVNHSGAWIVSDFIGGYLVARTYYGFNGAQALRAFRDEFANIRCNDCMSVMHLEDTDTRDDCPDCGAIGCLMDLQGVM